MSKNKKNKGGCKLNMKMIFMLTIIVTMAVSLVTLNSIVVPSSKKAITEEVLNNLKTAVEGQSMLIDEYITSNELIMREYGASNAVRELLSDPDNAQKQKAAQEFTERYFSNLENWEGIYTSNWDTTVLAHSTAAVVGMTTREGDALPPYQASMSEAPDGFFNGGVFTSPASGQMILNMRQGIQDANGNWVGLVGGGPFIKGLQEILDGQKVQGFENAKYTIVDTANSVYVTNADSALIAQPVDDAIHLDIISKVAAGDLENHMEKGGEIIVWKAIPEQHIAILIEDNLSEALAVVNEMSRKVAIATIIVVIVLFGLGLIAANAVSKPLISIADSTKKLSEGYIREKITATTITKETQDIIDAAKVLQQNLVSIVDNIKSTSSDLAGSVVDTNELCNSSASGATQISEAVDELSNATNNMAESVQTLADNMSEISEYVDAINDATDALSKSSSVMDTISEEAKSDIGLVAESAIKSVNAVENITEHMTELADSIAEITKATELIASISSQTSLLSLNASIEAARAGEAGRGFAVVASEISQLAEQSDNGTKQIDEVTKKVLDLSSKSRALTEAIAETIKDEQHKVEATQDSFLKLKGEIDHSLSQINSIAEGVKKLEVAKDTATRAVSDLSAISEENAATNEQVNASIAGLSANITDISDRSDSMSSMAGVLTEAIKAFKD